MRALDHTPLGYAVPYAAAATGNFIGGAAHTAVNEARRWGPAVLVTAIPGGTFLARAAAIDVFSQVKGDYKRDPVGTAVEDATSALAIASGGAGAAARVGSAARTGAAAGEGAGAGAGETAASGVARSQAGRSPWNATKDFAQSGWNHLGNLVTGDAPRDAVPRPDPGTPHHHDVGKPDRYVPPAKPTEGGNARPPGTAPAQPSAGDTIRQTDGPRYGRFGIEDLRAAAQAPDRNGLTRVGRALQKHSGPEGSMFSGLSTGSAVERNQQGVRVLDDILGDPLGRTTVRDNVMEIIDSVGRGARFRNDGSFLGFLEPR